jgi:chaperonin GroEL (HSP60 family)
LGSAHRVQMSKIEGIDHASIEAERGSTIILRGSTSQELDEAERALKSAFVVLKRARKERRMVPGGGAVYAQAASCLRRLSLDHPSREQLAVQAFADVLERVPMALAENFGLGKAMTMATLRGNHSRGQSSVGVGLQGCLDMREARIEEPVSVSKNVVNRACEVASLLLRVDDYFYVKALPLLHKT